MARFARTSRRSSTISRNFDTAQTRVVSVARIRLDPRKSVRPFKGIICGDISEFESRFEVT
jgi:hypothetical protein